jgi:hypothetical protein
MSDSRAGFAGTDPGVAGRGDRYPAPSLRPRGLPAGKASLIHHGPGPVGTPVARAGSPLRTSQGHHDNRAAPVVTLGHRDNPGRPGRHA